jgi:pimeloyl-ACP methyl ester carboxylesterase
MMHREIQFEAGNEVLKGTLDLASPNAKPTVLSLHGAGPSNRVRAAYITERLCGLGVSSFRFDFSGHGDSSGTMAESSLTKRLAQAKAASQFLDLNRKPILIGSSMGAHIAARLAKTLDAQTLILFCPAAYGAETENVQFGSGFSELIRRPGSYQNSLALADMRQFRGDCLIIIGDCDEIIPGPVLDGYFESSSQARSRTLTKIRGAPHAIHAWLDKDSSAREVVLRAVEFVVGLTK